MKHKTYSSYEMDIAGVTVVVEFAYHPAEKQIRWDNNNTGTPGSPEYFEILDVKHEGKSILNLLRSLTGYSDEWLEGLVEHRWATPYEEP